VKQLSLLALLAFSLSCFGGDKHDASAFFQQYIELSDNFDIELESPEFLSGSDAENV